MFIRSLAASVLVFLTGCFLLKTARKEEFWLALLALRPSSSVASSSREITSFSILGQTGIIGTSTIGVTVPGGTNPNGLVATFSITGESVNINGVNQISGTTANNFTTPKVYTVTAADSTTKNYTVTVTVGTAVCANGVVESPETCDDGNLINSDGCSNTCAVEPGFFCVGNPSACTVQKANGNACTTSTQCASGFCIDSVCSNTACTELCKSASGVKNGGFPGVCSFVPNGTDPDNECPGAMNCNGAGACI